MATYLGTLGFGVKDISQEQTPDGHWSPFDLLIVRDNSVYVVDVKSRMRKDFWFTESDLISWILYDTSATKMVLFFTSIMGTPTYQYVLVHDIPTVSYHKRNQYTFHIRLEDTKEMK